MTTDSLTADRLIRIKEVIRQIGLSRSQIYKMQGEGTFPRSVNLATRSVAWSEREVQIWVAQRVSSRTVN
ncbi:helix-turn-helix transcriptional regulator [Dyella terrae]|uniref:helix-turn-helix transcriptional regulator n=1 Tax=Dyella terrae TaxID=522259 RepID=UPI001EFD2413|nr:AlpA family phage regulatory protein [Dyella terrae]ULU26342.1 AlpA family transcriptional regulator [Dyella terrae]